tara:strand:+ start:2613 stop:3152 length:540 start_codon:yes stop_codon:yes gene_type:complete
MPKGQPRSPEEIVAEREQQLEKARIRLAQSKLKETPGIQALTDALDNVRTLENDAKKGFTESSPQSFTNRIQSHMLWIAEIEAQEALAEVSLLYASTVRESLRSAVASLSAEMLDAEDINDPAFLAYAVEAIEGSTAGQDTQLLASLSLAVEDAQAARKAFAESRKAKPEAEQAQEASA